MKKRTKKLLDFGARCRLPRTPIRKSFCFFFQKEVLFLCLALLLCLTRSSSNATRLDAGAFIWQRHWTPELTAAIRGSSDLFTTWHVLAAEISRQSEFTAIPVDWPLIVATAQPAIPVIRIEHSLGPDPSELIRRIGIFQAGLPRAARGTIEIDYDCPTARLAFYAGFLHQLRAALAPGTALTATALPTWLNASAFDHVATATDHLILQLHAIDDPRTGLFDPARARRWVNAFAARTSRPFMIALPAYGARADVAPDGTIVAVSAEMPALDGQAGREITADPAIVAGFLKQLSRDPPDSLRGVLWFRLPLPDDQRAWSMQTLRHVIHDDAAAPHMVVRTRPGEIEGMTDILIGNDGDADGMLPDSLRLPPGCALADGVGQYARDSDDLAQRGTGQGLLRAGGKLLVGWMRCDGTVEARYAKN